MKISVLNSNINNFKSITKIIDYYDYQSLVIEEPVDILAADKLIIPGISSFGDLINFINSHNLRDSLCEKIISQRIPVLAICAGLQILTKSSSESKENGLGIINAVCKKLPSKVNNLVPHHGWNFLYSDRNNIKYDYTSRYYFCHSYYVFTDDRKIVDKWCLYNISFPAIIKYENIIGTQFHPEKSLDDGMKLIYDFCKI